LWSKTKEPLQQRLHGPEDLFEPHYIMVLSLWAWAHLLQNQVVEDIHAENKHSCDQRISWHYMCARACLKIIVHRDCDFRTEDVDHIDIQGKAVEKPKVLRGLIQRFHRYCSIRDGGSCATTAFWDKVKAEWIVLEPDDKASWEEFHRAQLRQELSALELYDKRFEQEQDNLGVADPSRQQHVHHAAAVGGIQHHHDQPKKRPQGLKITRGRKMQETFVPVTKGVFDAETTRFGVTGSSEQFKAKLDKAFARDRGVIPKVFFQRRPCIGPCIRNTSRSAFAQRSLILLCRQTLERIVQQAPRDFMLEVLCGITLRPIGEADANKYIFIMPLFKIGAGVVGIWAAELALLEMDVVNGSVDEVVGVCLRMGRKEHCPPKQPLPIYGDVQCGAIRCNLSRRLLAEHISGNEVASVCIRSLSFEWRDLDSLVVTGIRSRAEVHPKEPPQRGVNHHDEPDFASVFACGSSAASANGPSELQQHDADDGALPVVEEGCNEGSDVDDETLQDLAAALFCFSVC
jgi:hypothetical protein